MTTVGVLYISALPDGFQSLASQLELGGGSVIVWSAPFADYELPFLSGDWSRRSLAGLAGMGIIYAVCLTVGRILVRQRSA